MNCQHGICTETATHEGLTADQTKLRVCTRHSYLSAFWGVWPIEQAECPPAECNAPKAEKTERRVFPGSGFCCKACKVRELKVREARLVATIREGALSPRGGTGKCLTNVRRQLARLA